MILLMCFIAEKCLISTVSELNACNILLHLLSIRGQIGVVLCLHFSFLLIVRLE